VLNLLVAVLLTPLLRARRVAEGADATAVVDYHADEGSTGLRPVGAPVAEGAGTR
jgi:SSS family solute:Na+ symporter